MNLIHLVPKRFVVEHDDHYAIAIPFEIAVIPLLIGIVWWMGIPWETLRLDHRLIAVGASIGIAIYGTLAALATLLPEAVLVQIEDNPPEPDSRVRQVVDCFTWSAAEEIVFRGIIQHALTQIVGLVAALLIASALFGLGHGPRNLPRVLATGVVGMALGILFFVTGNLWAAVAAHITINLISTFAPKRPHD